MKCIVVDDSAIDRIIRSLITEQNLDKTSNYERYCLSDIVGVVREQSKSTYTEMETFDLRTEVSRVAQAVWKGLAQDGARGVNESIYALINDIAQNRFDAGRTYEQTNPLLTEGEIDTVTDCLRIVRDGSAIVSISNEIEKIRKKLETTNTKKE